MTKSARCCDVHMARQAGQSDRTSTRTQRSSARAMGGKVLFGSPWRFSYDATMTVKEVYAMVDAYAERLLTEAAAEACGGDPSALDHLYSLQETGTEGSIIERDDESLFRMSSNNSLAIVWTDDGIEALTDDALGRVATPNRRRARTGSDGGGGESENVELLDCFRLFSEREQLGKDDPWFCPKCKDHVHAYKKFDLWSTPDILIIHLKRFQHTMGAHFVHRQKIDSLVNFPLDGLDLSEMVLGTDTSSSRARPVYDCYAVSEHMGGMGGGHYTATVKNMRNSRWYAFNDSHVSEAQGSDGVTPNAYVLFYKRRDGSARWAGQALPSDSNKGTTKKGRR
eukprot:CAMPEP_0182568706 /NCGR_PEP_ID=MMETSP1324-20130603/9559_1 /TAXON_ID=236786 /ORGANISM="Florenciella sp., Strain RCC1587" /LENGTH=338 /DNA_ID=CAMNT_0024782879 /DNA_START=36 /DNA_END=1052 /DNA_ORIENTATION=+